MDYLEYFGLSAEPFSHAPVSRFYYASRQHTDALKRLLYASQNMKGLAILVGDVGHGKTTLARRLLDALPASEFEAAMLVVVHAGVTASWLLKRIAMQLGVPSPADDKLSILSQLYERLVEVHESGRRAVVLIDEAQMLATRELMEEFRGLLNLEVPGHKLVSFVFFGLPEIERNLQLDPALAQRVALRYHLKSLGIDETRAYVQHRLRLADARDELFPAEALDEVHRVTRGVPRLINTLCDNVLLELFFEKQLAATTALVSVVAQNLGLGSRDAEAFTPPALPPDDLAVPGSAGEDAVLAVTRDDQPTPVPRTAEPVPRTAESVPRTAESVPRTAESVPRTAESVPRTAESVPRTAESVPRTAESVPRTSVMAAEEVPGRSVSARGGDVEGGSELEPAVQRAATAPAPSEDFDASFAAAFDHTPEARAASTPPPSPRDVASIQPKLVVPAPFAETARAAPEEFADVDVDADVELDVEPPEKAVPVAQEPGPERVTRPATAPVSYAARGEAELGQGTVPGAVAAATPSAPSGKAVPPPPRSTKATPVGGTQASSGAITTPGGTVDLDAIDDLLLELQRG